MGVLGWENKHRAASQSPSSRHGFEPWPFLPVAGSQEGLLQGSASAGATGLRRGQAGHGCTA